jgi:hypothetical protein
VNFGGADADNAVAARIRAVADASNWTPTSSPTRLEFGTTPVSSETIATRLTIDSAGLATFSNGINLGNTASATATTLDGYEEGTWTVALGGTTETLGSATGKYVRIGSLVWVSWYSDSTALASSAGAAIITGLPFTVVDSGNNYTPFTYQHGDAVDGGSRGGFFVKNSTQMNFTDTDSTNSATFVDGATKYIMVSGVYQTDDAF